ncbi:GNAT family protein [Devosia rhodophyticola]|uniref:GNAT family protein n=1 Tax=Devosia rhodophyticola TaxID=3026423 RepID=A0ABY7YVR3_9HYPH|nr:GNAT family protein [Devosia rhodophyticola]WDR05448.1 GNAT family protein [Devosia rhodophyticola]
MASLRLPIATDQLELTAFERSDTEALGSYLCNRDAQRYIDGLARDKQDVEAVLRQMREQVNLRRPGDTLTLAMRKNTDKELVGHVCLRWSDATAGQGELRFVLHPRHTGRGYAHEAIAAMLDLAFDHYNIHRVFMRCDGRNHHSAKLLEQIGMRLEAHYREHALFQGEWDEELHFAILDREWRPSSKIRHFPPRVRVA